MPTYEYECRECGEAFERFQGINEAPVTECPECGGSVRRLISSGGGLVFKGPGFYATDYRSGTGTAAGEKSSEAEKDGGATSSDKPSKDGGDGGD